MKAWLNLAEEVRRDLASLPRIDTPSVRSVRRRYSKVLASESPRIVLRFVMSLLAGGGWAERVVSWEVLAAHERAFGLLNDRLVEEMAHGLADWGSVDLFGVTVLGPAWRAGLVTDSKIVAWGRSQDRWRRRLALVATVPLNARARGGNWQCPENIARLPRAARRFGRHGRQGNVVVSSRACQARSEGRRSVSSEGGRSPFTPSQTRGAE